MPNPWAQAEQQTATSGASTTGTAAGATTPTTAASSGGGATTTAPEAVTSLLGGIPFNPEAMSSAFQAPYVRQLLETMTANPETFEAFLSANPVWAGASQDPAMREQLRRMMPQLARQMNRPAFVNMLSNPRALRVRLFRVFLGGGGGAPARPRPSGVVVVG